MSPLTLLFSSTPGANSNKAQGADFNSNDGGGDEGIFLSFFPLFDQQNKSLTLVHDSKPADFFLNQFLLTSLSFFYPFEVHLSALVSAPHFLYPTSFLFGVM